MQSLGRFGLRPGTIQRSPRRSGPTELKPSHLISEILYPLTELAVVLVMIIFLLLQMLAEAAGLLGIWLAIAILPAYFRYLLYLLETKANGRKAPVPGIELFNWVENFWSLFPLVLVAFLIWAEYFLLGNLGFAAAALPGAFVLVLYPASMAVLALTRSPVESLNPAALIRVVKACGRDYVLIPLVIVTTAFFISYLVYVDAPYVLAKAAAMYATILMFTLTGRVLYEHSVSIPIEMPPQREPAAEGLDAQLTRERTSVLNHAYGFISRGNREGGLQHLFQWIDNASNTDDAYRWFFNEMLKWESKEAALVLAQRYINWLLPESRDTDALKLISHCLLENPRFRPLPEDMGAALAAAERLGNDELYAYLNR